MDKGSFVEELPHDETYEENIYKTSRLIPNEEDELFRRKKKK